MENPRRSFDRSREPGLKKPRLTEDLTSNPNIRPFSQRANPVGPASGLRFRSNDSGTDDLTRGDGGAYEPQPVSHQQQHQQQQELVSQYKTALAELTFNSKPIITNLTIIAGENVHAAKAIAATVCANILEVPSDQKLPSLYLLDSIVKNIGRDYIKCFAARLPEVFCKAYRQVDPPLHQSMRHLFGTWKGVFPLQTLQVIEKELGFTPLVNGSSSGDTTSRTDTLSQRPPQSIHVNPKYLEKQRLQQSSRAKVMVNDMAGTLGNSKESERPDRAHSIAELSYGSVKMNHIQCSHIDMCNEPVCEKKIIAVGDYDYGSDLLQTPGIEVRRTRGNITDQGLDAPWFGATSSVTETIPGQRNGFNVKHGSQNYSASKTVNADPRLHRTHNISGRNSSGLSSSWKNSEEEEFMWEMHSRLSEHDAANFSNNMRKDCWTPDVSEKMDFESQLHRPQSIHDAGSRFDRETSADALSTEQKDKPSFGHQISTAWTDGLPATSSSRSESYSASLGGLPTGASSSLARMGMPPQTGSSHLGTPGFVFLANVASGSAGTSGKQYLKSVGTASPPEQSPMRQHSPSPSFPACHAHQQLQKLADPDYHQALSLPRADPKPSHFSGKLSVGSHRDSPQTSAPISLLPSCHHHLSQPPRPDSMQAETSGQTQKPLLSQISKVEAASALGSALECSNPLAIETSELSSTSSLLAAVMKSGILSSTSFTGNLSTKISQGVGQISQPPLPNCPPAVLTTSGLIDAAISSDATHDAITATLNSSQKKVEQLPLPPGPPPSSLVSNAPSQTSDAESKDTNPISNLLSSLVAKGLISASKKDALSLPSLQMPNQIQKSPDIERPSGSMNKSSEIQSSSDAPRSSTMDEVSYAEPVPKCSVPPHQSTSTEVESLIGLELRPEVIREFHSSVISGLLDDLPHCCSLCGLRLKLQGRLDRHLEWHEITKTESRGSGRALRGWYARSDDWLAGKPGQLVFDSTGSLNKLEKKTEKAELMVPADENQCACLLCGELFEDYFSLDRGEWMFKGAAFLTIPSKDGGVGTTDGSAANGPIVHAKCMSESSVQDLGLSGGIKVVKYSDSNTIYHSSELVMLLFRFIVQCFVT
ncbi:Pre-mRNA cleavage complex 2 Pcf11 [Gossypium australe]|uniref:Pre-mRNA cleavage complex 2 Pcf11 n=1 Tax=Gossypium australe TaxID=47621 RepID=A0A5B6V466_9ROSI|nr:Pre-mRNA cleavage complex 2 Pcf11 [Gossypium australe]